MRKRKAIGCTSWLWWSAVWLLCWPLSAWSGEAALEFLDGLRQRGYYDVALEYLDQMRTSPRCPPELKEVLDYEAGQTLVMAAHTGTIAERQARLDGARDRLQQFVRQHPQHELVAAAQTQLAKVLVERGRMNTELASVPGKSEGERQALLEEARRHYQEASKAFEGAEKVYYDRAKKLQEAAPAGGASREQEALREARAGLLDARLWLARMLYEIGKTYKPGSKPYRENLSEAAKRYGELYEKYDDYLAGLQARLWEGRVYKDLGQTKKALDIFKELMTLELAGQPPAFRSLVNQARAAALETYLLPEVKDYAEAEKVVSEWEKEAGPADMSTPEGLAVLYYGGKASLELAKTLPEGAKKRRQLAVARRRLVEVARSGSPHRSDALAALQDPAFGTQQKAGEEQAANYMEAKDKGDFAWGSFVVAMGRLQGSHSPKEQRALSDQMADFRDEAIRYYRIALEKADEDVPTEELNEIRFRLAYLFFAAQDYYRAAVLGEFLARRQPASAQARTAAEIAVKAYRALYTLAGPGSDRSFEKQQMEEMAHYVTVRWKGEKEADEAWMMLTDTAIDEGQLDQAIEYMGHIAEDSPRRSQAELRTGLALWAGYVRELSKPEEARPPESQLDQMLGRAQTFLQQGITRARKTVQDSGEVDYALARSALSLAQIHLNAGRPADAVAILDDPVVGPMTLVRSKHPASSEGRFAEETMRTALRAYVGAEQLEKAEEIMAELEKVTTDSGRLTQVYVALGRELQQQLERLSQQGREAEREKVAHGFEMFLERIRTRQEGNTFGSLSWVAETYMGLGDGLAAGRSELSDQAVDYYTKAAATYAGLLRRIKEKDPDIDAPEGAAAALTVRLAACLRKLGQYDKAMKLLVGLLRENEKRVDVQMEAARTYQDWATQRPGYYEFAMLGGQEENGHRLVWGWAGIASRVYRFPQYRQLFHEARYNLALCRMKWAQSQKSAAERKKMLARAELDIIRVFQIDPKMGGKKWYDQYNQLLKTIQKLLGKPATGLEGLE